MGISADKFRNGAKDSTKAAGFVREQALYLDFYGGLLSARQAEVLDFYYNEDYSLTEIANGLGISRQAAHEALRNGSLALMEYEGKLGLVKAFIDEHSNGDEARNGGDGIHSNGDEARNGGDRACGKAPYGARGADMRNVPCEAYGVEAQNSKAETLADLRVALVDIRMAVVDMGTIIKDLRESHEKNLAYGAVEVNEDQLGRISGGLPGELPDSTRDVQPLGTRHVQPFGTRDVQPFGTRHVQPLGLRDVQPFGTRDVQPFGSLDALEALAARIERAISHIKL